MGGDVALLMLTGVLAVADWLAVARGDDRTRTFTKPAVMVALIAAVIVGAPAGARTVWFIVALLASLAGDVALQRDERWFVVGLGSFLLAHLAYVAGMSRLDTSIGWLVVGALLCVAALVAVGRRIVSGAAASDPALRVPVIAYVAVISLMVVVGLGTRRPAIVVGALSFYVSDSLLGWNRFVARAPWRDVAVMVTYHVAQAAFVVSLL